jgi:outer membrane protein TolC
MRRDSLCTGLLCALLATVSGCGGLRDALVSHSANSPARCEPAPEAIAADLPVAPSSVDHLSAETPLAGQTEPGLDPSSEQPAFVAAASPNSRPVKSELPAQKVTVGGLVFPLELIEDPSTAGDGDSVQTASAQSYLPSTSRLEPFEVEVVAASHPVPVTLAESLPPDSLQLNLPTALSLVGGQHPAVGYAQWRVQQAYAQLDRARVLWLPSIQAGFSFDRHDGNYQASDGSIVDVNRNSFQYGLGAGAVGAGTTMRPGIVARFHAADAIFEPRIAEKTAWARGHAANGVVNEQLLNVALAYLALLDAEQDLSIVQQSQQSTADLSKLTADFAAAGQGLQADADRLETELLLVESRLASANERVEVASARLAQTLSLSSGQRIVPLDPTVVPIDLVSGEYDRATLISTGLSNRPELKESQALVAAACEQYQRQRYAPFVPSVLLGFSTGGFGGGLGNNLSNVDGRYDFDAILTWEIRNLGLGEKAARRESVALVQQAKFEKVRVLDQVAREVAEAHAQVTHRSTRIKITEQAIESAENSYQRNVSRIRDGQGLPLEVLQSLRALEDARRAYLNSVVDYNEAQFRLQWALGWHVFAPDATE